MTFPDRSMSSVLRIGGPVVLRKCEDQLGQIMTVRYASGDEVSFARIYPSLQKSMLIVRGWIPFPNMCVACGTTATQFLPIQPVGIRDVCTSLCASFLPYKRRITAPHCTAHSDSGSARIVLQIRDKGTNHLNVMCVAQSYTFIYHFRSLLAEGEMPPPWISFKNSIPIFGWNQGTQEDWMMFGWEPFWASLSTQEREKYLSIWDATQEWAEYLSGSSD